MWDTIVIGAGIEGSSAAYSLAKSGRKTLLVEQFSLPHNRGSSHGQSRLIRMAYPELFYTKMMVEAFRIWKELETETGLQLYVKTGLLVVDKTGSSELLDTEKSLRSVGVAYQMLTAERLRAKYPTFNYNDSFSAIFDPTGGILRADKCLSSFQGQFKKFGGVIRDCESVESVVSDGVIVTVNTSKSTYKARSVIIAAGPWTSRLTEPLGLSLPLEVKRVTVCYWKRERADAYGSLDHGHPSFLQLDPKYEIYGLPALEYPTHVKVVWDGGLNCDDPERRDAVRNDQIGIDLAGDVVRNHLLGIERRPSILDTCMYTVTPDKNFILDTHPKWKNIIIAAGFSGHGFKLSAVVGKILSDLATSGRSNHDLSHFAISRFSSGTSSSKL